MPESVGFAVMNLEKGRAPDPRPARTRAAILAAVENLPGLPPEQVTVTALVSDAGVSRSVFYMHFSGLDDLLAAVLADSAASGGSMSHPSGNSPREAVTASLTELVDHVNSRSTFYMAALTWKTSISVHDAAVLGYARRVRQWIELIRASNPEALPPAAITDFASTFVAGGLNAALTAWLQTDRATPSATLVHELLELMPAWLVTDEVLTTGTEQTR